MSLATTCPQCKTSFKVVPDQLKLRRGLVRCGVCQHVFSGIDSLRYVDDRPAAPAPATEDDDEAFDAALESAPGHDAPPDTEFFVPATTVDDSAPDGAFESPPTGPRETGLDDAFDASGRLVEDPGHDARGFDVPGPGPTGEIGAFDPAPTDETGAFDADFELPPEVAATDGPAAAAQREADGGGTVDATAPEVPTGDDTEVEHYDITAVRGWPQDDAELADEAAEPSHESPGDGESPPTSAAAHAASAAAPAGDFATPDAAGRGGAATGAIATGAFAAGAAAVSATGTGGRAVPGADTEQDAIDFFAPQRRVRGFSSRSAPLQWLAACVLVVALVAQLLIGARHWLAARAPDLEPLLAAAAGAVGLTVDPPRELDALTIESFELQASGVDKLFALVAHLRNRADHAVHWPAMELALTDSAGTLLARKVLMPSDYLGAGAKSPRPAGIGPGAEVPVRVALEVPGLAPSGYTVNIFYP